MLPITYAACIDPGDLGLYFFGGEGVGGRSLKVTSTCMSVVCTLDILTIIEPSRSALVTTPVSRKDIFVQFAHSDAAAYVARSKNASRAADKYYYVVCVI